MPLYFAKRTAEESAQTAAVRRVEEMTKKLKEEDKRNWQGLAIPTITRRFPKTQREEAKVQSQAIPKVEQLLPEAQREKEEGQAPAIPKIKALLTETHEYVYLLF